MNQDYTMAAAVVEQWKSIDCRADRIELTKGAIANLEIKVAKVLTTIRKETREAAFKSAAGIAAAMASGETYETGRQKALNIAAAIEAAANSKEGGGDG